MIGAAVHSRFGTAADPRSVWRSFLASPAAPKRAMSALELDGYLTGVIVAPNPIRPSQWMAGLWAEETPVFDDVVQTEAVLSAVGTMFNTLSTKIEQSLRRLEAERVCGYRPAYQTPAGKPSHEAVKSWVRGFWKAMQLTPSDWHALAADQRMQVIITPFVGFMQVGAGEAIELAPDINGASMKPPKTSRAPSCCCGKSRISGQPEPAPPANRPAPRSAAMTPARAGQARNSNAAVDNAEPSITAAWPLRGPLASVTPCPRDLVEPSSIQAQHKRRFRKTTDSNHAFPFASNLLARRFTAPAAQPRNTSAAAG